jgi:hypothetical protein
VRVRLLGGPSTSSVDESAYDASTHGDGHAVHDPRPDVDIGSQLDECCPGRHYKRGPDNAGRR